MSTDKGATSKYDDAGSPVPKRTFGQKLKRSCARFWWVYLIVLIVIACVVVFPVIFVGYPNIARKVVHDATLKLVSQSILNPRPNSFSTNLTTEIESGSPLSGVSAPFEGGITYNDQVMWNLPIPQYTARNGEQVTVTSDNVTIVNEDAFNQFSESILRDPYIVIKLTGSSTLQAGKLQKVGIDYDQAINITALNSLKGLAVADLKLNVTDGPEGTNANASVTIPNPSPLTLAMGTLTYDLGIEGTNVGNVTFLNFTLATGNQTYKAYIYSNQTAIAPFLLQPKYQCGTVVLTMYNGKSVYEGTTVPYLTYALSHVNSTSSVDLAPAIRSIGLGGVLKPTCET